MNGRGEPFTERDLPDDKLDAGDGRLEELDGLFVRLSLDADAIHAQ